MTLGLTDLAFVGGLAGGSAYDADALAFITAVEAADTAAGQSGGLETGVKDAYNAFFVGCKADGIWPAIKAACILAGAKTRQGALVPLLATMPAPTSFNFVDGDYNRKTGLTSNGSPKYLDSNRNNNVDPQDSKHLSAYVTTHAAPSAAVNEVYIGTQWDQTGSCVIGRSASLRLYYAHCNSAAALRSAATAPTGLFGVNRSVSSSFTARAGGSSYSEAVVSTTPRNETISVFRGGTGSVYFNGNIAFYSIGESLDLEKLDTRVTTLITAIGAAF